MKVKDTYEFFTKEFEFKGKHAIMCSAMWEKNVPENSYFQRLIDIYRIAPIIGFRMNYKAPIDTSTTDTKSIFDAQMRSAKDELDFILQMILMQEYSDTLDVKSCIDLAFRGAETEEQYLEYYTLFNDYVRGGVEILYEHLVIKQSEPKEHYLHPKTANIINFVKSFVK